MPRLLGDFEILSIPNEGYFLACLFDQPIPAPPDQNEGAVTMSANASSTGRLNLGAVTAAELMAPNPISIRHDAPIYDAVVLMTERRVNAAPVINDAGRP